MELDDPIGSKLKSEYLFKINEAKRVNRDNNTDTLRSLESMLDGQDSKLMPLERSSDGYNQILAIDNRDPSCIEVSLFINGPESQRECEFPLGKVYPENVDDLFDENVHFILPDSRLINERAQDHSLWGNAVDFIRLAIHEAHDFALQELASAP